MAWPGPHDDRGVFRGVTVRGSADRPADCDGDRNARPFAGAIHADGHTYPHTHAHSHPHA